MSDLIRLKCRKNIVDHPIKREHNDYMDSETIYKYYNEMMWPERFASCISAEAAIKMRENL